MCDFPWSNTAQFPPSPELAGFVDAGALRILPPVVALNRWERQPEQGTRWSRYHILQQMPGGGLYAEHTEQNRGQSGWELMGAAEPRTAQLRPELTNRAG